MPSRPACGRRTRTRSGWRRPARRSTGSVPSSTSAHPRRTDGWRGTRSGSGSSSATAGSHGTTATRATPGRARSASGRGMVRARSPIFVPERFAGAISRAAQRWNVSAALISAQLYAESNFNPFAQSPAGAQGIAQFMPGTARSYGLSNPFDADAAIDAQAHLMRDLLARFASGPARARRVQRRPGAGRRVRVRAAVPGDARVRDEDPRPARRRGGADGRRAGGQAR